MPAQDHGGVTGENSGHERLTDRDSAASQNRRARSHRTGVELAAQPLVPAARSWGLLRDRYCHWRHLGVLLFLVCRLLRCLFVLLVAHGIGELVLCAWVWRRVRECLI